jgi:hypothetical protein
MISKSLGSFVLAKRGLVDEDVGAARGLEHGRRWSCVACEHEPPTRPRWAEDLIRRDDATIRERHALAALQGAALRPGGNSERVRRLDVEAAWAGIFDEHVADGRGGVLDGDRVDAVMIALENVARAHLDELERCGVQGFVRKPFRPEHFRAVIDRVLGPQGGK